MNAVSDIKCFLLDLDGTVYLGDTLFDGAREAIQRMRLGSRVIFLTNNSSTTRDRYVDKLCAMGIPVTRDDVYTSINATCDYLGRDCRRKFFVVSSPEVREEFRAYGLNVDDPEPDAVILTFDKTLDYAKLTRCCDLIDKGAFYVATHPDMTCPTAQANLPDIGSFMRLIEGTTGRTPDVICGKPNTIMAQCVSRFTGIDPSETAMVGDRLYTDMRFAAVGGFKSILTLSGETSMDMYLGSGIKADKIINSIAEWDL